MTATEDKVVTRWILHGTHTGRSGLRAGEKDRESVYVTNFAIGPEGGAGPGVVRIKVGVPGL